MKEVWKEVPNMDGIYEASNFGRVRSVDRQVYNYIKQGRVLKTYHKGNGYLQINLRKYKAKYLHRVVALTFIPNPDNKPCVNHKNFDKKDNRPENLEWVTYSENIIHFRKSLRSLDSDKKKKMTLEKKFDLKVYKNKDTILGFYASGDTIEEIVKKIEPGRDFIVRILRMHGKLS